jgi:hypothetical protein
MKNPPWRAGLFPLWIKWPATRGLGGSDRVLWNTHFTRAGYSWHSSYRIHVHPIAIKMLRIPFMLP